MPENLFEKKRIFIVDGYGQIYRSYFAFFSNPLRDADGNNVSAIFGFFNNLMMLLREHKPDYVVVALDSKGKTFRHEMYPEYKANREKTPEDLHAQIPRIVDILDSIGIKHFEKVGMEADDIIASLTKSCTEMGLESVIVTGDKDLMQLVNASVFALRPPRKNEREYRLCNGEDVKEIFGVRPDQICDYLTILGDSSDNVPGIDGIGEKGAVKLLTEYGTLDGVYSNIDKMSSGLKTKLENAKGHLELSHKLIELKNDLFEFDEKELETCKVSSINWLNAIQEFYAIKSDLLVRSAKKFINPDVEIKTERKFVPVKIKEDDENYTVPDDFKIDLNNNDALIGYDLKTQIKKLKSDGIAARPYFDVMVAYWLLDSSKSEPDLDEICERNNVDPSLSEYEKYRQLVYVLFEKLKKKGLDKIFFDIEMPLISILSDMEYEGILLDAGYMKSYEKELTSLIETIEQDIYTVCGHPFNIASPKQLQEVLFTERKLEPVKKTKSGYSTDSEVLEELSYTSEDPVPEMILRYRALTKLLSTYVATLPQMVDEEGRVHTTFVQTGTATGRLSAKNPNLQNIPVRTEEGKRIRTAFTAKNGCTLISADYAQIELAVLASVSKDKALSEAFINAEDVHRKTASLIFSIFPELVTDEQRRIAKTINFGVIYGMSAFRLSQELKIPRRDAQNFIDTYFAQYEGIAKFIENVKKEASKTLEVSTKLGHVRKIPDLNSSNKTIRNAAERVAVNTVIQGTAAEIVKCAMLSVSGKLKENNLRSKILLQVHDEIILEVPDNELEAVQQLVKSCMEGLDMLSVPLRVSISTGHTWGEL